jgi:hypothetical protein
MLALMQQGWLDADEGQQAADVWASTVADGFYVD